MNLLQSGAATLPRGFRYDRSDMGTPRTPEPSDPNNNIQPPSPPRPRFKLKRRNVSHLNAPTQQFLASVAAADVPIPSIEAPDTTAMDDEDMSDTVYPAARQLKDLENDVMNQKIRGRTFSPPRTPAPGAAPSLSPRRFPDWSIGSAFSDSESSIECDSSRPSTARSTQTSASMFSRFSRTSDDLRSCSPLADDMDIFATKPSAAVMDDIVSESQPARRKAPWTRAMSHHLWSTYVLYQQDPKVTPFRIGKSSIPPHGVCLRVAREAKRSWKGARAQGKHVAVDVDKSGSSTPTAETAGAFIRWPHTTAATRAHLRELCRIKASSAAGGSRIMSNSPTPFARTVTRFWNRRSTPARTPSVFSAQDMAMSLAMSTSEVMQPQGPLAQLTSSAQAQAQVEEQTSAPVTLQEPFPPYTSDVAAFAVEEPERRRLGSPFVARSYGPSSSGTLLASMLAAIDPARPAQTVGPRRTLQSPVRLTRSRSNTQKRRTRPLSIETRKTKRPSLASDLWTDPSLVDGDRQQTAKLAPEMEFSSTSTGQHDELFVPRTNLEALFPPQLATAPPQLEAPPVVTSRSRTDSLPARLGSPFAGSSASYSFPNRLSQPEGLNFGAIRRPFATIQQSRIANEDTAPCARQPLATRLAYIDQRLRELRRRGDSRGRSGSPS